MSRRRVRSLRSLSVDAAIAVVAASGILAIGASAHPWQDFYPRAWFTSGDVPWQFQNNFPGAEWRARVQDGAQDWNSQGQSIRFSKRAGDTPGYQREQCPRIYQWDFVQLKPLPEGKPAVTDICAFVQQPFALETFVITFNNGFNWYRDTGNPPGDRLDLWSAASHEFGHGTGWGPHFSGGSSICTTDPKHTMCPTLDFGQAFMRGLAPHDAHTFGGIY